MEFFSHRSPFQIYLFHNADGWSSMSNKGGRETGLEKKPIPAQGPKRPWKYDFLAKFFIFDRFLFLCL